MRRLLNSCCLIPVLLIPTQGHAQATANAIAGANDAFGFKKGDETVGIYDETSARGFSLEAAGNYRVQGNYFVKNSGVSSFFLESTTVRIGFNTMPVTFPSPSGVVDYSLRDPKDEANLATIGIDAFMQPYGEIMFRHGAPSGRASGSIGFSYVPQMKDAQGGSAGQSALLGGTGRISPGPFTFRLFGGEYRYERPSPFRLSTSGPLLKQRMTRNKFIGIRDLNDSGARRIGGVLADVALGKGIGLGLTTVFSQEDPEKSFLTLFDDLRDDGSVNTRIISSPAQKTTSVSSEARLNWAQDQDPDHAQRVDLVVRHRSTRSKFGGARVFSLGRTQFGAPLEGDARDFEPDGQAELHDRISQFGAGVAYRAVLGRFRINGGLLRTSYRKEVTGPGIADDPLDTSAWLYNVSAAYRASDRIEVYAGMSRGLEEAGIAPASATNRFEILPPAKANQKEAAIIFRATPDLKFVLGAFDLERGYFGTEGTSGAYQMLGRVRHRGVEFSAAGKIARGLSVVLGGVILDPEVQARMNGADDEFRPTGVPKVRLLTSADYQLGNGKTHVDGSLQFTGSRQAVRHSNGSTDQVEGSWVANLGLRTPVELGSLKSTVRFQILNLFNSFTWDVTSAGTMAFSSSRRFRLVLTTEF